MVGRRSGNKSQFEEKEMKKEDKKVNEKLKVWETGKRKTSKGKS